MSSEISRGFVNVNQLQKDKFFVLVYFPNHSTKRLKTYRDVVFFNNRVNVTSRCRSLTVVQIMVLLLAPSRSRASKQTGPVFPVSECQSRDYFTKKPE